MTVKTSKNNFDCSNPIYKQNEIDKFTNFKNELENKYKKLKLELFQKNKKQNTK